MSEIRNTEEPREGREGNAGIWKGGSTACPQQHEKHACSCEGAGLCLAAQPEKNCACPASIASKDRCVPISSKNWGSKASSSVRRSAFSASRAANCCCRIIACTAVGQAGVADQQGTNQ